MSRSSSSQLEPFDPEIKRIFCRLRNLVEAGVSPKKERQEMDEIPTLGVANMAKAGNGAAIRATRAQKNKTLIEYAQQSIDGTGSWIRKAAVQANNFELKSFYVSMI